MYACVGSIELFFFFFHRRAPRKYASATSIPTPIAAPIPIPAFAPPLSPVFSGWLVGCGIGEMVEVVVVVVVVDENDDVKVDKDEGRVGSKFVVPGLLVGTIVDDPLVLIVGNESLDVDDEVGL